MPAGPSLIGAGAYCAVKLAGYALAARFLHSRSAEKPVQSPLLVGLVRMLIGIFFGTTVLFALSLCSLGNHGWVFFAALIPVRLVEWWLLFALFYSRSEWQDVQKFRYAGLGILWSFFLDLPAILAVFAIPGGFWVC